MENLVRIDRFGRLFIPAFIRKTINADKFEIKVSNKNIVLKPIKNPLELFGTLPDLNANKLKEVHDDWGHESAA
ncbi:MAG: hypothetical protein MSIBF_02350 [Candidatus Altiarchaeales archaeon IMC4]|nr:MAG: hypothetical protein MSIBF_02350 [Candidatus Altiarchaeales archaeon IMC4]